MLAAVSNAGSVLSIACTSLRKDREVAVAALKQNPLVLHAVGPAIQADKDVVLWTLCRGARYLEGITDHIAECLFEDEEIIMALVQADYEYFELASLALRSNRQFVLCAVHIAGLVLRFAADFLRSDMEIVRVAVLQNIHSMQYASASLRSHEAFVAGLVAVQGMILQFVDDSLCENPGVVLLAVRQDPKAFQFAGPGLRSDRVFVFEAVRRSRVVLQFVCPSLQAELQALVDEGIFSSLSER